MQHAGLHDRSRPDVADRLRQSSEAIADDDQDVDRAAIQDLGQDLMPVLRALAAVAEPEPEDLAFTVERDTDDGVDGPVC